MNQNTTLHVRYALSLCWNLRWGKLKSKFRWWKCDVFKLSINRLRWCQKECLLFGDGFSSCWDRGLGAKEVLLFHAVFPKRSEREVFKLFTGPAPNGVNFCSGCAVWGEEHRAGCYEKRSAPEGKGCFGFSPFAASFSDSTVVHQP